MKVKYIIKNITQHQKEGLTINEKRYYDGWSILPEEFAFTYGKEYIVYGVDYSAEGLVNLMLINDHGFAYPQFYPIEFFEIIDNRLSNCWINKVGNTYPMHIKYPSLITFKEIIEDQFFFDKILDCRDNTCSIFQKYQKLMDNEFPDKNLQEGIAVGDNWVMCYNCDEAWQVNNDIGVIECPKCLTRQNNPYYK